MFFDYGSTPPRIQSTDIDIHNQSNADMDNFTRHMSSLTKPRSHHAL